MVNSNAKYKVILVTFVIKKVTIKKVNKELLNMYIIVLIVHIRQLLVCQTYSYANDGISLRVAFIISALLRRDRYKGKD